MNKLLIIATITLSSLNTFSQITFEKGYFITNAGEKTNCLIKNVDWRNNPTKFEYKLSEESKTNIETIENILEFGVINSSKYKKVDVDIDRSNETLHKVSYEGKTSFKRETLFLKVLIEGDATLYRYKDKRLTLYFYNITDKKIEQLIFKSFLTPYNTIGKNEKYKQQLSENLECESITVSEIENSDYRTKDLINLFVKYNLCKKGNFIKINNEEKQDIFNLSIRPRYSNSSLSMQNSHEDFKDVDFGNKSFFRIGIEAEIIMPFNKNKWGVILEPTYQYFKSEKEIATKYVKADYSSIEIPAGIRHYFFLNKNSKLFINGLFIFDLSLKSEIDYDTGDDLKINTRNNLAFGFGYNFNEKFSLELRYQTNREILSHYIYWDSQYKTTSIILGYNLF